MSMLSSLLTESLGEVVSNVGNAIDNLVTSDEEKLAMRNELVRLHLQYNLEFQNKTVELEKEISKRWVSDNEHFLTRLVRPIVVISMLLIFIVIILFDGNAWGFTVNPQYIPVLEGLLNTVVIAYFSGRSIEKGIRIHNEYKQEKTDAY